MAEVVAVMEVAGGLVGTLKGLYALYTLFEAYKDSNSEMLAFQQAVEDVEGKLQALRALRITFRQTINQQYVLLPILWDERMAWKTLDEVNNRILCSLRQNPKAWEKRSNPQDASKGKRVKWAFKIRDEAEKVASKLTGCERQLVTAYNHALAHGITIAGGYRLEALIRARNDPRAAMNQAMRQAIPEN